MTTPRERDDVIERLLKRMQADAPASAGSDCVDAELLARWAEGDLSGEERGALITHTASCARCQALLFAMVRSEPAGVSGGPRRWSWMLVRWGAPLAAAAALALWFAVDRDVVQERTPKPVEQASSAPTATKPPPPAPPVESPRGAPPTPSVTPGRDVPADQRRARVDTRTDPSHVGAPPSQDARELMDARAKTAAPLASTPGPLPVPPPPAANPAATEAASSPSPAPAPPPASPTPSAAAQSAQQRPVPSQVATDQIPGGGLRETVTLRPESAARSAAEQRRMTQADWVDVHSPDPIVRWRFTPRGDVERSVDAGLTWTRERIPGPRADLVMGVAPTSSVCWLAGRDGMVLRYTTEQGWQHVPLPVRADVLSLAASDAQKAVVRVRDRQFTTMDGGKTWQ